MLTIDKRDSHGSINVFNAETELSGFLFSRMNKSKQISPHSSIDLYIQSPSSDKITWYRCNIAHFLYINSYTYIFLALFFLIICNLNRSWLYMIHQLYVFFSLVLLKESQWLCSCVSRDEKMQLHWPLCTALSNLTTVLDCVGTVLTWHNPKCHHDRLGLWVPLLLMLTP